MTRLPVVDGIRIIKALYKLGYRQTRQKGSHIRLECVNKKINYGTKPHCWSGNSPKNSP